VKKRERERRNCAEEREEEKRRLCFDLNSIFFPSLWNTGRGGERGRGGRKGVHGKKEREEASLSC